MGHRASGAVGPGAAAWRSSLAGQPGGAACAHACADVGCIDCRIDAGRCVRVEVCWIDICGDARDAAIDVGCIEGCIFAGCTGACSTSTSTFDNIDGPSNYDMTS